MNDWNRNRKIIKAKKIRWKTKRKKEGKGEEKVKSGLWSRTNKKMNKKNEKQKD